MKFHELLNSGQFFDCPMVIGDVDMPADLVWSDNCKITEYGIEKFKEVTEAECEYHENGNWLEVHTDNWELGQDMSQALAGYYISEKEYDKCFKL